MTPCPTGPPSNAAPPRPRLLSADGRLAMALFPRQRFWSLTTSAGGGGAACLTDRVVSVGNWTDTTDPGSRVRWLGFGAGTGGFDEDLGLEVVCNEEQQEEQPGRRSGAGGRGDV